MGTEKIDELVRQFRELSLELKRANFRAEIHEALLVRTRVALHLCMDQAPLEFKKSPSDLEKSFSDARDQLISEIEAIGSATEKLFLSPANAAGLDDSEKALYADEVRAIVDHMKTYVPRF